MKTIMTIIKARVNKEMAMRLKKIARQLIKQNVVFNQKLL